MSGLTTLERALDEAGKLKNFQDSLNEKAQAAADGKGEAPSASDWAELEQRSNDVLAMSNAAKASNSAVDVSNALHGVLNGAAGVELEKPAEDERPGQTGLVNPSGMTLGEALAMSPLVQEFAAGAGNSGRSITVPIQGSLIGANGTNWTSIRNEANEHLITTQSDAAAGLTPNPVRLPGITDLTDPSDVTIRSLCSETPVNYGSVEFLQIYDRQNFAAVVDEAQTDEQVGVTSAHLVDGGGAPVQVNEVRAGKKPYTSFKTRKLTANVRTIAVLMKETVEVLEDIPRIISIANNHMVWDVRQTEDEQILLGTGVSGDGVTNTRGQLRGIMAPAPNDWGIPTYTLNGALSDVDNIAMAHTAIRKYNPNTIVMNSVDWYSAGFALNKDLNGAYRFGGPMTPLQQTPLWGMRVVINDHMPAGNFLLGNFRRYVEILDRMRPQFKMTESNEDDFEQNLVTMRLEERIGVLIRDARGLLHVQP